jgi:hypothetical protein
MKDSPFVRSKKVKLALGVLAVALMASTLMGVMLFFIGRQHPQL